MNNKNEVFEYLIDCIRHQVNNNPYKQQCEDLAHEVQSLKNQLRDASAQINELQSELQHQVDLAAGVYRWHTAYFDEKGKVTRVERGVKSEQSGCRNEDAQGCEHDWRVVQYAAGVETNKCRLCGVEKEVCYGQSGCRKEDAPECEHDWYFYDKGASMMCKKCGLKK